MKYDELELDCLRDALQDCYDLKRFDNTSVASVLREVGHLMDAMCEPRAAVHAKDLADTAQYRWVDPEILAAAERKATGQEALLEGIVDRMRRALGDEISDDMTPAELQAWLTEHYKRLTLLPPKTP